jgi:hypothetical protein
MKHRLTSAAVVGAAIALGSSVLASAPAHAGGTGFHWKGGYGWHRGFHYKSFGFYGSPILVSTYRPGFGCTFVKKFVLIPGHGFVKKPVKVCGLGRYY